MLGIPSINLMGTSQTVIGDPAPTILYFLTFVRER